MSTALVTPEQKAECAVVQCFRPECASQCGFLKWFGNLSDCDVTLQYQLEDGKVWHSLGTYPPGNQIELGGGVLLLPSLAKIRVVEALPGDALGIFKEGRVLANWGVVGTGLPTLFVDNSNCRRAEGSFNQPATSTGSPVFSPAAPCPNKVKPPMWLWLTLLFLALVAVALGLSNQYLYRLRQKYTRLT